MTTRGCDWSAAATFSPADPPRHGSLLLWHEVDAGLFASAAPGRGDVEVELARRQGSQIVVDPIRARAVPASAAAIELLTRRDDELSPSGVIYRRASRFALELIERGRLVPAVTRAGFDAWQIDPLEPSDLLRLADLAAAAPAHAFALAAATPVDGSRNRPTLADPIWLLRAFLDAVADGFVRTPAAAIASGSHLWAAAEPSPVGPARPWTTAAYGAAIATVRLGLRIEPLDVDLGSTVQPELGADERADDVGAADVGVAERMAAARFAVRSQLRSANEGSLVIDVVDLPSIAPAIRRRLGPAADTELLVALGRVRSLWSTWGDTAADDGSSAVVDLDGLMTLVDAAESLEAAGIEVLWPASFSAELAPKLVATATADSASSDNDSLLGLSTLLEFHWQVFCDGERLSDAELNLLADAKRTVVFLRGRWVRTDPELVRRLRTVPDALIGPAALAAAIAGETTDQFGDRVEVLADPAVDLLRSRLSGLSTSRLIREPDGLNAILRPYQSRGVAWMEDLCAAGLGGILADDMGLGKTLQIITLHLLLSDTGSGPTLIVVPTSVLGNWRREFEKFAPDVEVSVVSSSDQSFEPPSDNGVVITTYGLARRNAEQLADLGWAIVVADEAQHIKNPRSRVARAMRVIGAGADARIALTGTPVENRLSELWALLDWACPGVLGPADQFRTDFVVPIEKDRSATTSKRLSTLIRPFMLRRRKTDPGVADDLPPRLHHDVVVPLSAEQLSLYEALVRESLLEIEGTQGANRVGMVFRLLTSLKQIANHPALYLHEQDARLSGRSGKLDLTAELVATSVEEGAQLLVFSQYVEMCHLLRRRFADDDVHAEVLHGGLSAAARDRLVDRFQSGELRVLVISLKAGGTGLNLTAASEVIHFDRWWNPAVEDQATDRAWRIGQKRTVSVFRLIAEGTIDERIAEMIERKRALAESVVGGGEAWIAELDDDALAELVSLRSGPHTVAKVLL